MLNVPKLYSAQKTALKLSISVQTLLAMVKSGAIPYIKISHRYKFTESTIKEMTQEKTASNVQESKR